MNFEKSIVDTCSDTVPLEINTIHPSFASLTAVVVLTLSAWLVFFQNTDLDLRQNKAFAFLFNGFTEKDTKTEKADVQKAAWQAQKNELKKEAEQIVFTEDELLYMEYFVEQDENELWLSNMEVEK